MGRSPAVLALPPTARAPAVAREHVQRLGSAWPPELLDAVLLAVSEVVTNAVRYGEGRLELRVDLDERTVRVEVSDDNPVPPQRRTRNEDELVEGGLGLHLLDALARSWGVRGRSDPPGKTVWLEFGLPDGDLTRP